MSEEKQSPDHEVHLLSCHSHNGIMIYVNGAYAGELSSRSSDNGMLEALFVELVENGAIDLVLEKVGSYEYNERMKEVSR